MPPKKVKVQVPGKQGLSDAYEIAVAESTERWSEVRLEDGSVLRLKPVVLGAVRIEDMYDQEGNPVYQLKVNQIMSVADAPEHLRKGASSSSKTH